MTEEQKKIKKEEYAKANNVRIKYLSKRLFTGSNLTFLAAAGTAVAVGLINKDPVISGIGLGLEVFMLAKFWKLNRDAVIFSHKIVEQIHDGHPEYEKTKQSYYQLIGNLAEFMKKYEFDDPLDIGLFYQQLLHNGILSVEGDFGYYDNEDDYDIHPELDGARVCSGKAVCRHMGKNLSDLYNAMGIVAAPMLVKGLEAKNLMLKFPGVSTICPNLPVDHLNVAVASNRGRFIIDPTWKTVAEFGYKGHAKDNLATIVFSELGPLPEPVYYIGSDSYQLTNNVFASNYMGSILLVEQPRRFEDGEIRKALSRAKKLFIADIDNIIKFRDDNLDLIMDVYRGEKHISFNAEKTITVPIKVKAENYDIRRRFYDPSEF